MIESSSGIFSVLFGNRHWYLRVALLLLMIAPIFGYAGYRGTDINPPFGRCQADPVRFNGADLWVPMAVVTGTDDTGMTISSETFTIRVETAQKGLAVEDMVTVRGIFHNDGKRGHISAMGVEKIENAGLKNRAIYVVSGLMFLIVLWMLSRTFTANKQQAMVLTEK